MAVQPITGSLGTEGAQSLWGLGGGQRTLDPTQVQAGTANAIGQSGANIASLLAARGNIPVGSGGEAIGAGIAQAGASIGAGLMQRGQRREAERIRKEQLKEQKRIAYAQAAYETDLGTIRDEEARYRGAQSGLLEMLITASSTVAGLYPWALDAAGQPIPNPDKPSEFMPNPDIATGLDSIKQIETAYQGITPPDAHISRLLAKDRLAVALDLPDLTTRQEKDQIRQYKETQDALLARRESDKFGDVVPLHLRATGPTDKPQQDIRRLSTEGAILAGFESVRQLLALGNKSAAMKELAVDRTGQLTTMAGDAMKKIERLGTQLKGPLQENVESLRDGMIRAALAGDQGHPYDLIRKTAGANSALGVLMDDVFLDRKNVGQNMISAVALEDFMAELTRQFSIAGRSVASDPAVQATFGIKAGDTAAITAAQNRIAQLHSGVSEIFHTLRETQGWQAGQLYWAIGELGPAVSRMRIVGPNFAGPLGEMDAIDLSDAWIKVLEHKTAKYSREIKFRQEGITEPAARQTPTVGAAVPARAVPPEPGPSPQDVARAAGRGVAAVGATADQAWKTPMWGVPAVPQTMQITNPQQQAPIQADLDTAMDERLNRTLGGGY